MKYKKEISADAYISLQIDCFFKLADDMIKRGDRREPEFEVCKAFVDKWLELNDARVADRKTEMRDIL